MNRTRLFHIIQIGSKDDRASRFFDIFIATTIILNISAMFLETFDALYSLSSLFHWIELITVIIFCIEYVLRIWTADLLYPKLSRRKAILTFLVSFDGIIDLLTILPFFYLSGFVAFRMLRVVRIFHLFRINNQYDSFNVITTVIKDKRNQIASSLFIIIILMLAASIGMYSAEHEAQPEAFNNAFSGMWWAVSALLTVGYGDIYPITFAGKVMAIITAFLGVGVVAIPTGILSAGFVEQYSKLKQLSAYSNESALEFVTIHISEKHNWRDLAVKDTNLPQGLHLALINRNDEVLIPTGDTVLLVNDTLILSAETYYDDLELRLSEKIIEENDEWANKAIKNLDISRLTTIISIRRKNKVIIPHGNTIIKPKDRVIIYSTQHH